MSKSLQQSLSPIRTHSISTEALNDSDTEKESQHSYAPSVILSNPYDFHFKKKLNDSTFSSPSSGSTLAKTILIGQALEAHSSDLYLPRTYEIDESKYQESNCCQLCDKKFKKLLVNKHHCRKCYRCVCDACSTVRRKLSRKDDALYRICDFCDFKFHNRETEKSLQMLLEAKNKQIQIMTGQLQNYNKNINEKENAIKKIQDKIDEEENGMKGFEEILKNNIQIQETDSILLKQNNKRLQKNLKNNLELINAKEEELAEANKQYNMIFLSHEELIDNLGDCDTTITNLTRDLNIQKNKLRGGAQDGIKIRDDDDDDGEFPRPRDNFSRYHRSNNFPTIFEEEKESTLAASFMTNTTNKRTTHSNYQQKFADLVIKENDEVCINSGSAHETPPKEKTSIRTTKPLPKSKRKSQKSKPKNKTHKKK